MDFVVEMDGEFHHSSPRTQCDEFVQAMVDIGYAPDRFKTSPLDGIVIYRNGVIVGHAATKEDADVRIAQLVEAHVVAAGTSFERAGIPGETIEQTTRRIVSVWYSAK